MAITLTELAAQELRNVITQENLPVAETRLRVGVKGGGCGGYSYVLEFTGEPATENDEEMESNGIKIVVDSKSLLYLDGTEIDYKNEVMRRGFFFNNPRPVTTCGCGSSFSV